MKGIWEFIKGMGLYYWFAILALVGSFMTQDLHWDVAFWGLMILSAIDKKPVVNINVMDEEE